MAALPGVYRGSVLENIDPQGLERVFVRVSGVAATGTSDLWARVATLGAGRDRGVWFMPEIGDEVLVAFERGDVKAPCVIGSLWNARAQPPAQSGEASKVTLLKSKAGVTIRIVEDTTSPRIAIETPGGQGITLTDGPGGITIADSNGNSVRLAAGGVTVSAAAKVTIQASTVELSGGVVTINAGITNCSGVVRCQTLITDSVVSSSYTPGAGNLQ